MSSQVFVRVRPEASGDLSDCIGSALLGKFVHRARAIGRLTRLYETDESGLRYLIGPVTVLHHYYCPLSYPLALRPLGSQGDSATLPHYDCPL